MIPVPFRNTVVFLPARLLLLGWLTFDDPGPSGFNPVLPMSFLRLHLPVVIPIFLAEDLT
jgi:hypothetical protein